MSRLAMFGAVWVVAALSACGDDTTGPPVLTLVVVAGDHQSANVGRPLASPLTVSVTANGTSAPGVPVRWKVVAGGGTLSATSSVTNAQGQATVNWTLGNVVGVQTVTAALDSSEGSFATFSATAAAPIILHYDGTAWNTALEDLNGAGISLTSIWGASASALFAVGKSQCNVLVLRYDGTSWGQLPSCQGSLQAFAGYTGVWGSSPSDVFATWENNLPLLLGGGEAHFNGQNWIELPGAIPCPTAFACARPRDVWSSSPNDAFVVAERGMIGHYDGTSWASLPSGTDATLAGVWGVGPDGAVFAVGDGGIILRYDRSAWNIQVSGTTQLLNAVWGTSANDVFAVGAAGTILHYDGTSWSSQNSGSTQALFAVWGITGNSVFAVGNAGTILHYDGTTWAAQNTSADINLRGVWGSSPTDVFAVGAPR